MPILIPVYQRIEKLEAEIVALKRAQLADNSTKLWTLKDIARYTQFSDHYVRTVLSKKADFPPSVCNDGDNARKRYLAGDVVAYFEQISTEKRKARGEL